MNKALFMYHLTGQNLSISDLAKQLPISRQSLHDRLTGKVDFKVSEIKALKVILNLTPKEVDQIFFDDEVSYKDTIPA
ncbi:MAG: helix-turn-helix transcriptional regulator [Clostridia bacterium]|nr:helix-turn-helix transcriptional regulator [Clostridia bacterium]